MEVTNPKQKPQSFEMFKSVKWPEIEDCELDKKVAELSEKYTPLAVQILKEAIRIPEDHINQDPMCGQSNHEKPRLDYLTKMIIEEKAVTDPKDVFYDEFGNLVWLAKDESDGIPIEQKKVIYFDGHTDTVAPLPEEWRRKIGGGIDVYKGLIDSEKVNVEFLKKELGYLPPKEEWNHLVFGRGSADQLSGVVAQIIATKIMIELIPLGALKGVVIRSIGTIAEEDNDGGGPMYIVKNELPKNPLMVPDVVIHTEGTGDKDKSACGIYIGQRGRMQIQVEVVGKSSHGSMPWEGLNPLEYGSRIIAEAQENYGKGIGFLQDGFLGGGTRTASWCSIQTPSNCAVPASFVFRFDRRLTVGETPEMALKSIEDLEWVKKTREDGLTVTVSVQTYNNKTWKGAVPGNPEIYMGWMTPPEHQAVLTSHAVWRRIVSTHLLKDGSDEKCTTGLHKEPRIDRWIFSTDGVGYPIRKDNAEVKVEASKKWVDAGDYHHPAQIGMGIGFEQNTHKVGEFIDARHFPAAIGWCARFPSLYYEQCLNETDEPAAKRQKN